MKLNGIILRVSSGSKKAFSLIETVVGMGVVGIVFVTLYTGVTFAFKTIQVASESLQATQVIQSKMEVMRLYSWSQVTTNNFIPTTFQQTFKNFGQPGGGLTYTGTVVVTSAGLPESYSNSLKKVIVSVTWPSGKSLRQREMTTLISQYGMQNYIYY